VTWTNHDNFSHSVQVQGQAEVHMMKPGETAQISFTAPGDYPYVCTLHAQNMRGTISVG
jgi:plastocyanin